MSSDEYRTFGPQVLTNDAGDHVCEDPNDASCSARCKYYLEQSFNKHKKGYWYVG